MIRPSFFLAVLLFTLVHISCIIAKSHVTVVIYDTNLDCSGTANTTHVYRENYCIDGDDSGAGMSLECVGTNVEISTYSGRSKGPFPSPCSGSNVTVATYPQGQCVRLPNGSASIFKCKDEDNLKHAFMAV
eukprot:TRINITY_DN34_c0_g3_i3.p1 TRINITY_DN34_c0_g3~~TRINITY_DN34_c0_g3_i3.p1  ORF type:complete len:144 (+),score=22.29 TRINITY_DN34_c0_g3_i3:42-434(+)